MRGGGAPLKKRKKRRKQKAHRRNGGVAILLNALIPPRDNENVQSRSHAPNAQCVLTWSFFRVWKEGKGVRERGNRSNSQTRDLHIEYGNAKKRVLLLLNNDTAPLAAAILEKCRRKARAAPVNVNTTNMRHRMRQNARMALCTLFLGLLVLMSHAGG